MSPVQAEAGWSGDEERAVSTAGLRAIVIENVRLVLTTAFPIVPAQ
jgi:hypothetical protein